MQPTYSFVGNAADRAQRDRRERQRARDNLKARALSLGHALYYGQSHYHKFEDFVRSYRTLSQEAISKANVHLDILRHENPEVSWEFIGEAALMMLWREADPSMQITFFEDRDYKSPYDGFSRARGKYFEVKMLTSQNAFLMPVSEYRHRLRTFDRPTILMGFHLRDNVIVEVRYGEMRMLQAIS